MSEPYWEPLAAASSLIAVSSTPPASPVDGQLWFYQPVANVTMWTLRYNTANVSSQKWEFVGGSPIYVSVTGGVSTASTSYTAIDGTTPTVTLARAGAYLCTFDVNYSGNAIGQAGYVAVAVNGTAVLEQNAINPIVSGGQVIARTVQVTVNAGDVITLVYKVSGGTGTFAFRDLSILPQRVA